MASDDLYTEINHVLSKFSQPFLVLLQVRPPSFAATSDWL